MSIMKAAVSDMMPRNMRSTGFGIFETGFGIAWFFGSWILGALYDVNPGALAVVSVLSEITAIIFYFISLRKEN